MEFCKECGFTVMVQIQKNTGFCRPSCADKYRRKTEPPRDKWCHVCNAWHRVDAYCEEVS